MSTTTALPPMTVIERTLNARTGRREIWSAMTSGWRFVRTEEPGTPWYAEETDTGLTSSFGSLLDARRAAAGNLHEVMQYNARRALIDAGNLASHHVPARYRCACGGLLTDTPDRRDYRHIDGCTECVTVDLGERYAADDELATLDRNGCDACPNASGHMLCREARPEMCFRCDRFPAWISVDCDCGREGCCGCCTPD